MECDKAREAISALIDGEEPGLPDAVLQAHLSECAACQAWQHRAHGVTRRARLGGAFLDRDLSPAVLAAVPVPERWRLKAALRIGLVAVALAQLAITVPCLILGQDHDAGVHAAHELGSFDLALAIAFAVGAIRPALSAGLAWPCGIAACGLVGTAVADLISGATIGADEAQHLIAVLGTALLCWQVRTGRTDMVAQAAEVPAYETNVWPIADAASRPRLGEPPDPPGGGEAARVTVPAPVAHPDTPAATTLPEDGHGSAPQVGPDGTMTPGPGQRGAEAVA